MTTTGSGRRREKSSNLFFPLVKLKTEITTSELRNLIVHTLTCSNLRFPKEFIGLIMSPQVFSS